MSPFKHAKSGTEHGEQAALFCWLAAARLVGFERVDAPGFWEESGPKWSEGMPVAIDELRFIFAIPNGGARDSNKDKAAFVGGQLKAQGVKRGVPDIFVPIPRHGLHGLWIEMKRADGGTVSKEQKEFLAYARSAGYAGMVAYGWLEAAEAIRQWMRTSPK